ncbi:MAG TPA: hypothetical protein VGL72_21405 [Bryobacteraceae bacterium]
MRTTLLLSFTFLTVLLPRMEASTQDAPCIAGTLLSYESNQGGCELGGANGGILVFSGFTFSSTSSGSPVILDASEITVTPDPQGLGGGFIFGGFTGAPVLAGQTAQYDIDYSYFIDAGPVSSGADIGMDPPFGNVSIIEAICADSIFVQATGAGPQCEIPDDPFAPQILSVDDTNPPTSLSAHLDLKPIVTSFANIQTTISLNGGSSGAGFDSLTATSTVVDPTPEPLTLLTALGGLLVIGLLRRRSECG